MEIKYCYMLKAKLVNLDIVKIFLLPGVGSNTAHATKEYGNSNDTQANNSSNSAAISTLECLVEYLSNGIATRVVIFIQKEWDVDNSKGNAKYVTKSNNDRYPNGTDYSFWSIRISILGFLSLGTQSLTKTI